MLEFDNKFTSQSRPDINLASAEYDLGNKMLFNGKLVKNLSGFNVQYYYAIDTNEEQPDNYFPSNGSFDIPGNTFTSGVHTIKVIFKKKGTNYILYTFTETVNVFDNLTTNTWVKNGDEPYLTTNGGTTKCIITKECVDKFAQKTFYVDSSRQTTNSSASNYTTESGTYFNPFVKVSDAVNRINAGSAADYTIYVKDGTKEENITTNLNIKNNVNIETYKNSVGDGLGNATLEYATIAGSTNAVAISANKVSITGIKFLNTSDSNTEKTGISVSASSSLTMKRCTVERFIQDNPTFAAGGILILGGASVDITDCVISKNTGYQGGGIHNKGTLTLTDCTISGNTATNNGGGIYNTGTLTFSGNCLIGEATKNPIQNPSDFSNRAAGTGGGIYTTKPFTVKNGNTLKVYGNIALSYGGGIQIELSEEGSITGLDVQNCYAQGDSSHGGGISIMRDNVKFTLSSSNIKNCKATIGGGVYDYDYTSDSSTYLNFDKNEITECSATEKGGGLYLSSDSKCNLKDTKISGCSSEQGGGIYNAGTCIIKKAIITGCKTTSDTESNAKGGAIYNTGSLTLGDSICNSDDSPDVIIGIGTYNGEEYTTPNEAFKGAGVYSGGGTIAATFTMNKDCVIGKYNPTSDPKKDSCGNLSIANSMLGNGGAGVFISDYNKTMTINGGFISYNYAENTAVSPSSTIPITGVGLYYSGNENNPEIKNLVISYNKANIANSLYSAVEGVGIYLYKSVTLNNVKIEMNAYDTTSTTSINGKGLYSNPTSTVTLKGTTYFGTDDDIYLNYENSSYFGKINVDSTLNPQNISGVTQQYVATITPGSYTADLQILKGTAVTTEYFKFAVKPNESGSSEYWLINKLGQLAHPIGTKMPGETLEVGDIVFNDGSSIPYSEGLTLTDAEKSAAIAVIFRVGDGTEGNKTLGVGIKKSAEKIVWCSFSANGYNMKFNTNSSQDGSNILHIMTQQLSDSLSDDDTRISWNADGTIDFTNSEQTQLETNYPAFEFAYYYGKNDGHNTQGTGFENGWYLPTMYELNDIYSIKETIDNALDVAGGDKFGIFAIWSSNQDPNYEEECMARVFNFGATLSSNTNYFYDKSTQQSSTYACAVRAFN